MSKSASINVDLNHLYSGWSSHVLDGSNRYTMPARWKHKHAPTEFNLFVAETHLVILPFSKSARFLEEWCKDTTDKLRIPEMERLFNRMACPVSLDSFSRLQLPVKYTAGAGIEKEVEVVGRSWMFEIWSPEKLNAPNSIRDAVKIDFLKRIENL